MSTETTPAVPNRWTVAASLVRLGKTRYTPAGLPVQELGLRFVGTAIEARSERRLDFEFDAVAVGEVAGRLAKVRLGTRLLLDGFLAPPGRRSRRIRLHIVEYATQSED